MLIIMPEQPRVSIIIPVFNQLAYTQACIDSLASQEAGESFEVIVVNNGSSDGTAEYLATKIPPGLDLHRVEFRENKGFSLACNAGAEQASAELLLFLNNDTLVTPGWLKGLCLSLEDPSVGIVGPKLVYVGTENINHCGYVCNEKLGGFYPIYHNFPASHPAVNRARAYQALLGACVLLSRDLFFEVGGFSDFALEDIDLCLKIRARGKKAWYNPKVTVYHHGSVTLKNSPAGTLPSADVLGFNDSWPISSIEWDDMKYYQDDGFDAVYTDAGFIQVREKLSESYRLVTLALETKAAGNLVECERQLREALELYPHNREAYQELILLYSVRGDLELALEWARKYLEREPEDADAKQMLLQLTTARKLR